MSPSALYAERLGSVVGAGHVSDSDGRATVRPGAAGEIVDVLRVAREVGAQVGFGAAAIALDLGRMKSVLHLDETSLLVQAQAGVTLDELETLLGERGLTLGPLPATSRQRTLGAMLAAPRPSEATPRTGRFTATCAAIHALLADGTELQTRLAPRKATGPDLMHALVGARGTLGLITAATLRVWRRGEAHEEAAWALPSLEAALGCARQVLVRGGRPADMAVSVSPAITLSVTVIGPQPLAAAERALVHRLVGEHGGRPVPHTPPPLMTAPPEERAVPLETITAVGKATPPSLRVVGWHPGGAAFVDPARGPAAPPPLHPLVAALKKKLDPDGRLPPWPN